MAGEPNPLRRAARWEIDPIQSTVEFTVTSMGIPFKGLVRDFAGAVTVDQAGEVSIRGSAAVESIDTRYAKRDRRLRSEEFFDASNHPEVEFEASTVRSDSDGRFTVRGELAIKGTRRDIEFQARIGQPVADPWGDERIGIDAVAELDRRDFGLHYDDALPDGTPLVGHRVQLELHLGAVRR